ncbi:MAG: AraC family transcriptional regulator [Rubrivivax sp.]|nr:MAG: AraC family transcriptional regulator [Rubrivivax sp.]
MTLQIIDRPATTVVGLLIHTTPMSPDIPALWPGFVDRIPQIAHPLEDRVTYGVMQTPGDDMARLDYMAGIAVAASGPVPEGMTTLVLPAGLYARFSYPLSRLGEGFGEIFNRLLPESAYVQRPGPLFERYGQDFCPDQPGSPVEIWLPVAPKA